MAGKIYFPNLNGLRFIAALLVIVHHTEQFKSLCKLDSYWNVLPFIKVSGKLGVVLFFVLSGFLITYLLLSEENKFGKFNIRQFYVRRILRIWPLYFFTILLAFALLPYIGVFTLPDYSRAAVYENFWAKLFFYVIFLPNFVVSHLGVVPYASHTWSIGTEEQFYLGWPVLLRKVKQHRMRAMWVVIGVYLGMRFLLHSSWLSDVPNLYAWQVLWDTFPIDCMAIGGIFALLLYEKRPMLKLLLRRDLFYASVLLVVILIGKGVKLSSLHYEFYSVFFAIIILNFAANDRIGVSLEHPVLRYLGKISYGLYMYHPMCIVAAIAIGKALGNTANWALYPLTLLLTVFVAGLSFRYLESGFLKLKQRFTPA